MAKTLLCLLTTIFVLSTAAASPYCRLNGKTNLQISGSSFYGNFSLSRMKKGLYPVECTWAIIDPSVESYLDLNEAALNSNDSLHIVGRRSRMEEEGREGGGGGGKLSTLYRSMGRIYQGGLLSLAGYDLVTVRLVMLPSAFSEEDLLEDDPRTFFAYLYSGACVELLQDRGQLTFPVNSEPKAVSSELVLLHKWAQEEQLILLNFTRLPPAPANAQVTVGSVPLTMQSTSPMMFLEARTTVSVDLPPGEQITFNWWLADRACSEQEAVLLKVGDQARPIRYLGETERREEAKASKPVRCVMRYTTEPGNRFSVHLPTLTGVADLADSVHFYDERGQSLLELNSRSGKYSTPGRDNTALIDTTNSLLVVYESPTVIAPSAQYQAPQIKVVPKVEKAKQITEDYFDTVPKFMTVEREIEKEEADYERNVEFAFLPVASLHKLVAPACVPLASLLEYTTHRVTLQKDVPVKEAAERFAALFSKHK